MRTRFAVLADFRPRLRLGARCSTLPVRRKVFLVTDKDATPGVFAALSANLRKYKYVFADIHSSDAQAVKRLGVDKVSAPPAPTTRVCARIGASVQACSC